jgi:hypothetical protein
VRSTRRRGDVAPGDRLSDPSPAGRRGTQSAGGGHLALLLALGAAALVPGGLVGLAARRRRRLERSGDPEVEELRIALIRTGRAPANDLTLARLERLLDGSEGALGYLRSLRLARYGGGAPPPTGAQRRALRRELGAGLGVGGRLRSLWALPPRSAELLDALRPSRRRSYTA